MATYAMEGASGRCLASEFTSYKYPSSSALTLPLFISSTSNSQTHHQPSQSIPQVQIQIKQPQTHHYHNGNCQVSHLTTNLAALAHMLTFQRDTFNAASDKVNELTSGASKEANKDVAKDSDASLGTRAQAAGDAMKDKKDEMSSSVSSLV